MRTIAILGAAGLFAAAALPAAAQTSEAGQAAPPAAEAGASADASAQVAVGQAVKDNTSATIGTVTDLKANESGGQVATVQMGADSFAVDASSLAVQDGAAVINASEAEIKNMMKK